MDAHASSLLSDIGLSLISAAVIAHLARVFRQPLILGYVLGGVLLGGHLGLGLVTDETSIELISEIGLILLLFIIGLEINFTELKRSGKPLFVLGIFQFLICSGLAYLAFSAFSSEIPMITGRFDVLYLAVAVSISSTMIVVKMLHDKFEINTASGRLTVGILIFQDVWAIVFLAVQPNLMNPALGEIARSFGLGVVLVAMAFLASRYILSELFNRVAKVPELVLVTSVAWCFSICGLADWIGLSKEMGALIAGMSLGAFPYGTDVIAKLVGIRDFFVTLFFVSLGLKMPMPSGSLIGWSLGLGVFVLISRLIAIAPLARLMGRSWREGFVSSLNLSQISEFSLVIVALGVGYGHVSGELQSLVLTAMLMASVLSPYMIWFNDRGARLLVRLVGFLGVRESQGGGDAEADCDPHEMERDIVLLGCYHEGMALLRAVDEKAPELRNRILVIDYNPAIREELEERGYRWAYGDLAHPETLEHIGIHDASIMICSVPDTFLKGITNLRLLKYLKRLSPQATYVMTSEDDKGVDLLLTAGATEVIVPSELTGKRFMGILCQTTQGM